jgi:hypothetical protein
MGPHMIGSLALQTSRIGLVAPGKPNRNGADPTGTTVSLPGNKEHSSCPERARHVKGPERARHM